MNDPMPYPPPLPASGLASPAPPARPPFWKRHWVHVVAAFVVGAGAGGATAPGSLRDQNDDLRAKLASSEKRVREAESRPAPSPAPAVTVYVTPSAAPATKPPAAPPAPPAPPKPPAAPSVNALEDNGWQAVSLKTECSLGDWAGTARIRNTNDDADTAIFTFTLFRNGKQIATLQGSASDVETGRTVTVQLISTDSCSRGAYTYEFQTDMSY